MNFICFLRGHEFTDVAMTYADRIDVQDGIAAFAIQCTRCGLIYYCDEYGNIINTMTYPTDRKIKESDKNDE